MTTGSALLAHSTNDRGRAELEFANPEWRLRVEVGESLNPYQLLHLGSGRYIADENYCYRLTVAGSTGSGYSGGPLACRNVRPVDWWLEQDRDDSTLVLLGQLDFGPDGPTSVQLEHRVTFSSTGRVVEQLSVLHHRGRDRLELISPRFGFRKTLFDRSSFAWRSGADDGRTGTGPPPAACRAGYRPPLRQLRGGRLVPGGMDQPKRPARPECRGVALGRSRWGFPGGEVQPGAHRVQRRRRRLRDTSAGRSRVCRLTARPASQ